MAIVRLPAILAREAGGQAQFETQAATLRGALSGLPVADLLFDPAGELRQLINVFVDGEDARAELDAPLPAGSDVRVVAAVAGGSPSSPGRILGRSARG